MAQTNGISHNLSSELNPYVGQLANQLMHSAGRLGLALDDDGWRVIREMLDFAAEAEQQIANQRQRINELECMAQEDELTGLVNRRGLTVGLRNALARARRYQETGVIGYFDLDDFKMLNDTFGHRAGDKALKHVATVFKSAIRSNDIAARLGGDEFVIYLDHADWREGARRLHDIRDRLAATPMTYGGVELSLQASLGVAPFGPDAEIDLALSMADEAMYADKRAGRARIAV